MIELAERQSCSSMMHQHAALDAEVNEETAWIFKFVMEHKNQRTGIYSLGAQFTWEESDKVACSNAFFFIIHRRFLVRAGNKTLLMTVTE